MRVMCVDDEITSLNIMKELLSRFDIIEDCQLFNNSYDAVSYVKSNHVDLAFIDVQLPGINGIDLTRLLRLHDENINIVFVTAFDSYALDAFKVDAIGYIMKPVDEGALWKEIMKLKNRTSEAYVRKVQIRTFGTFDIFVDGKLVVFKWPKSKEFLAVLVDHQGGYVPTSEMLDLLFTNQEINESVKSYYRSLRVNIKEVLSQYGAEDILIFTKNGCALDSSKVDCDLYNLLNDDEGAINDYRGKYMTGYPWANDTLNFITQKLGRKEA